MEEIVFEGYSGYLFDLENVASLIEAMIKIAKLKIQNREQMFRYSLKSIEQLTWDKTALNILN